jgi:hypothetical protein
MLTLLVVITGLAAFFVSYGLFRFGMTHMCTRYPIAVLVGYVVLLALVRGWVELERADFDPEDLRLNEAESQASGSYIYNQRSQSSQWDWLHLPDFGDVDFEEGCLPALLIAAVVAAIVAVVVLVMGAPALIAEVFLDAFIVSVLYRRLRIAEAEHWLGTALRKTWVPAVVTAAALFAIGWILEQLAPGAHSIGQALEQLRR